MNLIQKQAADFYESSEYSDGFGHYKPFVNEAKTAIHDYHKVAHKIEFIDEIIIILKRNFDSHMLVCQSPKTCPTNKFYENTLFFLEEKIEELEQQLPVSDFNRIQKQQVLVALDALVADLNNLKTGQQITYDDLMQEFKDLRDFLYLDKANFTQLLLGKITEMAAGGIVSETVSKSLLDVVREHYPTLINFRF